MLRYCQLLGFIVTAFGLGCATAAAQIDHVLHISVDGLRGDAIAALGPARLPNMTRLRNEGMATDNARCDADRSVTMPNHVSQISGIPVLGAQGHTWTNNSGTPPGTTLHQNRGSYVTSVFDLVHDSGLRTGLYASKSKFSTIVDSYDSMNGRPDPIGPDDGPAKIDQSMITSNTTNLIAAFLSDMTADPFHYALLHFRNSDSAGHGSGWDLNVGSAYATALETVDGYIGQVLNLIDTNPLFVGRTAIILTSDHGGVGNGHSDPANSLNARIPFIVWGPGVAGNTDIYVMNPGAIVDPGLGIPAQGSMMPPIRNGFVGNLALQLLGLPSIPASSMGISPSLNVLGPVNLSPLPTMSADVLSGTAPLNVNFDATASSDPDGSIALIAWDFGDGNSGLGGLASHTFTTAGVFPVTVMVYDDLGALATLQTVSITVLPASNQPPTLTVLPPDGAVQATDGLRILIDDPNGLRDLASLSIEVEFGGIWIELVDPQLFGIFQITLRPQGDIEFVWPDLGFLLSLVWVPQLRFRYQLGDLSGALTNSTSFFVPAP